MQLSLSYTSNTTLPPPDEAYFGHDASKASLALMEERWLDDPRQAGRSLLLPAGNDLEPIQKAMRKTPSKENPLLIVLYVLFVMLTTMIIMNGSNRSYLGLSMLILLELMGFLIIYRRLDLLIQVRKLLRKAYAKWKGKSDAQHQFKVFISPPWIYENTLRHCDYGLAIFDSANHMMVIEGLHYRYFIRQADVKKLTYLENWAGVRDVCLTVMMNNVPFEMVLSKYSLLENLPSSLLPFVTPRHVRLVRETFGNKD